MRGAENTELENGVLQCHARWHDTSRCPLATLHEHAAESNFRHAQSVHAVASQLAVDAVPMGPPDDMLQYCLSVQVLAPHEKVAPA
jgi:hypothetical protein